MNRIATLAALCLWTATQTGEAEEPVQVAVFAAGTEGYHTFRIPSLLVTPQGTVLAFCEARKDGPRDAGDIDLVLKRSTDGGRTFGPLTVVWDDEKNTCGNPCPVVDAKTGTIWLLLTHNLGGDKQDAIVEGKSRGTRTVWVAKSADDGKTWSKPVDITAGVKKAEWTWYATGPGVGSQVRSGRLLIPCNHYVAGTKERGSHVIYSDDGGASWKLGGIVGPKCNESQAVELADGSVMLNIRGYQGNHRRLVALSKDGGERFSEPQPDWTLVEPVCQGSILRLAGKDGGILFSNPASTKRENLTVRLSRDEGKTWAFARSLHRGRSGYSCLGALDDGTVLCLYERGDSISRSARAGVPPGGTYHDEITLARFSRDWLIAEAVEPTPEELKAAIRRSLPMIEKSAAEYRKKRQCFSCHHQAIPVLALTEAERRGFKVDKENLAEQIKFTAASLANGRQNYLKGRGQGGQFDTAGHALWTLEIGDHARDETTAAVVTFFLNSAKEAAHWHPVSNRPPTEGSRFTTMFVALRGLTAFGVPDDAARIAEQRTAALAWLVSTQPKETEDRVFRLRALGAAGADREIVEAAAFDLVAAQRTDGGWSQTAELESDAYATGTVLVALHQAAGVPATDSLYRRGVRYLAGQQRADGTWHVRTRSKPIQTYFETGFPYEKDQFISMAATSWATMAMVLTQPVPDR